ncbi:MAG: carboxypeptidase-like regulatory domain-containing protein, partial [Blastocatellia bacterium]
MVITSFLVASVCLTAAQNVSGTLSGLVLDTQSSPIANASIVLTDERRDWRREITSDANGQFRFTGLLPSNYQIEVRQTGFSDYRPGSSLRLLAGETPYLSITLRPVGVTESIVVTANLDEIAQARTKSNRGGTFSETENTDLPMVAGGQGRNYRTQVYLLPGVTPSAQRSSHAPFSINGLRPVNTVNVMVDGADFNDPLIGILNGTGLSEQPVSQEVLSTTEVQ